MIPVKYLYFGLQVESILWILVRMLSRVSLYVVCVYICSSISFKYGTRPTLAIFPGMGSILHKIPSFFFLYI